MGVQEALKATETYGVAVVMLFLTASFLAALMVYVLKQNAKREERLTTEGCKREERLANIIEIHLKNNFDAIQDHDKKTTAAIAMITEAQKYVRSEHEAMLDDHKEQTKILNSICMNLGLTHRPA